MLHRFSGNNYTKPTGAGKLKLLACVLDCVSNVQFYLFQNSFDDTEDDSIVIEDSDSESSRQILHTETVDTNDEYLELIIPDGDGTDVHNDVVATTTNQLFGEAEALDGDSDNDKAFGMLIAEELRKMTPHAQQKFKHKVTQFLYS